ncbi:MAG: hypothetical protein AAFR77_00530 [Cyanobacteria bacterium J06631_2]
MDRQKAQKWCQQNNWTELRLSQGNWVAFPPGETRVTPLPDSLQFGSKSRMNLLLDLAQASILLTTAILVGAIAVLISPFFRSSLIKRHKKSQSQPRPGE